MTQDYCKPQAHSKSSDVFRDLYALSHERALHPDLYDSRKTLKGMTITFVLYVIVVVVSFIYPVSGVVFYGVFRGDRTLHARTGLLIFLANLAFAVGTHILRVLYYA